jgi:hypothetical protein
LGRDGEDGIFLKKGFKNIKIQKGMPVGNNSERAEAWGRGHPVYHRA